MAGRRGWQLRPDRLKELRPAPGELRLVQAFLNSVDFESGTDELSSVQGFGSWLERHALMPEEAEIGDGDLQRAIEFRESLRQLVAAGESASRELGAAVDRALASARLSARFEAGGELHFEPAATGFAGVLSRFLAIIAEAQNARLWSRLKICASGTCRAAFYEAAANRTRLWCLPRCGSRVRGRDWRRRRKSWGL